MSDPTEGPLTIQQAVEAQMRGSATPDPETEPEAETQSVNGLDTSGDLPASTEAPADPFGRTLAPETEAPAEAPVEAAEPVEAEPAETPAGPETVEEPDDDAEYIELEPDTPLFSVKGQDVTYDEARKGYLRQDDYSRARQEVAQTQKELTAQLEQARAEREQYADAVKQFKTQLAAETTPEVDWDVLREDDPVGYLHAKEAERERQDRINALTAEENRLAQEQQAENQRMKAEYAKAEMELLNKALPEWQDQEVAKKDKTAIAEYLDRRGYSREEIAEIYDHRVLLILRDAITGAKVETATPKVRKKIAKVRPMMRKAGRRSPESVKSSLVDQADKQLSTDHSVEAAVALQIARLEGKSQ